MHGSNWQGQNVAGWWVSEKLDGWRAYWNGRELLTRQGTQYTPPDWFLAGMPDTPLDGELWAGPGSTHDDVNRHVRSNAWHRLRFCPFDIPVPGLRVEAAQALLRQLALPEHVRPVDFRRVRSTEEALATLRRVICANGEGVMLRRPGSPYYTEHRSPALLKMKGNNPK